MILIKNSIINKSQEKGQKITFLKESSIQNAN